jgi:hypothetical protein
VDELSPAEIFGVLAALGTAIVGGVSVVGALIAVILFAVRQGRSLGALEGRLGQAEASIATLKVETKAIGPIDARLAELERGHKVLAQEARERLGHVEGKATGLDGDVRELKILMASVKEGIAGIAGSIEELRRYVTPPPPGERKATR